MNKNPIIPFFMGSNIPDKKDIKSFNGFMKACSGNTGNSYITYSLIKELKIDFKNLHHIKSLYMYDYDNSDKDIDYINNVATHVFLILQDQIRIEESYGYQLPYQKIQNFISKLNKPVIIAGLCANSFDIDNTDFHKKLNLNLINFLKFLSDHCVEIGVRGDFSHEILNRLGINNVRTIGCPSYFENGRNRIIKKQENFTKDKILVNSGFFIDNLMNNHHILQDVQEEKYINPICFNNFDYEYNDTELKNILFHKYHIFSNPSDWKNFIKRFYLSIGYRLHGSIISINSGLPAVCCNQDSRAKETCAFLKIPHYSNIADETDFQKLYEELDINLLNKSYPELFDNYIDFLNKNNVILHDNIEYDIKKQRIISIKTYKSSFLFMFFIKKLKIEFGKIHARIRIILKKIKIKLDKIKNHSKTLYVRYKKTFAFF